MHVSDRILSWIPIEELRILVRYLIADAAALTIFKFLILYAGFLFPEQHGIIINIELNGLFLLIAAALFLMIVKIVQIGVKGIWYGKVGIIWA